MVDISSIFYFSVLSAGLVLSLMGMWFTSSMPGIDRWSKRFFMRYFIILNLCCVSCFAELIEHIYPVPHTITLATVMIECLLLSLPLLMLTVYLLHSCGERLRSSRLFYLVLGLWAVYCILLASSAFTDRFNYVTTDQQTIRGPLYPLLLLPLALILLSNLIAAIRYRKRFSRRVFHSFLIALMPMTAALITHLFIDVFPLIDISYVLSAMAIYNFALSDQINQNLRHQREIANQRASIMVLQMRPHFIYNTMTSIYCLCNQDPKLARQVILDFTTYLRKNFTAIASEAPIPFSAELEHTRAYLAVEQAQYEDCLFVDYDTPHIMFRVPPLTLQPIVENAIKHGRDPYAGPFHISIRTRKTNTSSEIIIADDGCGFSPTAEDNEPHIALNNIRERLEFMCKGSLTIMPNDGGGTVVTVSIPYNPPNPFSDAEKTITEA